MNSKIKNLIIAIGIPTVYAMILRFIFGIRWNELFDVMSISFLVCLPFIVGFLSIYFSKIEIIQKTAYTFFFPWIPIFVFFVLTLILAWEGWACWLMVLPLFLLASSIGGLIARYLKLRRPKNNLYVSAMIFIPFLMSPIESLIGSIPETYEAYTYIDIHASADKIWSNVTRVKEIPEHQDKGWLTNFLGFPRPVKAELDFLGEGGYRKAIFTNGLVFHETVTDYIDNKRMVFTIKANPHEIPSATMDEHVVIGGEYFDVLNGTYELEKLDLNTYRLHLYSHFKLTTSFNFYAGWWAKWIMKDIQNNILQIEKYRAEM